MSLLLLTGSIGFGRRWDSISQPEKLAEVLPTASEGPIRVWTLARRLGCQLLLLESGGVGVDNGVEDEDEEWNEMK